MFFVRRKPARTAAPSPWAFHPPPFAPDARLKYHCTLYASSPDRVQSRSSQPGFSLACRGRVLAYRCAGSAYRECTQVFGYSVVKVQERAFHLSIGHFLKSFKMLFADRRKSPLTYKDKKGVKINLFLEKTKRKIIFVGTTKYCILKLCRITTKKAKEKAAKCNTGLYKNERRISEYPCSVFLQTKKPDMLTFRADDSLGVIHVRLFGDSLSFSTHGPVARYVQTRMNIMLFCDCSQVLLYPCFSVCQ